MTTKYNVHHVLYRGEKVIQDPGDAGTIWVTKDLQICEMVVSASNETRTLGNPTKAGVRFVVRLKTDGGGVLTLTAANGLNPDGNTVATFSEEGDFLSLISVSTSTAFRWDVLEGNVGVPITSSSVSNTPSSSVSNTRSSSPSSSVSNTPSSSVSNTPSRTPSSSVSNTPSSSPSSSVSSSPSAT